MLFKGSNFLKGSKKVHQRNILVKFSWNQMRSFKRRRFSKISLYAIQEKEALATKPIFQGIKISWWNLIRFHPRNTLMKLNLVEIKWAVFGKSISKDFIISYIGKISPAHILRTKSATKKQQMHDRKIGSRRDSNQRLPNEKPIP